MELGDIWAAAGYLALCCLLSLAAVLFARDRGTIAVVEPAAPGTGQAGS